MWVWGLVVILSGIRIGHEGYSTKRSVNKYRKRLHKRGMARFEVLGLAADRELIRSLAKRFTHDSVDSARIRAAVRRTIAGEAPKKGGILSALRRSPLVAPNSSSNAR